jgi:hypothetical protein
MMLRFFLYVSFRWAKRHLSRSLRDKGSSNLNCSIPTSDDAMRRDGLWPAPGFFFSPVHIYLFEIHNSSLVRQLLAVVDDDLTVFMMKAGWG